MPVLPVKEFFADFLADCVRKEEGKLTEVRALYNAFTEGYCVFHEVSFQEFNTWLADEGYDTTIACAPATLKPTAFWIDMSFNWAIEGKTVPRKTRVENTKMPKIKLLKMKRQRGGQ